MKAKNVITAILASIFSILLVVTSILAVLSGTVAATVTKKGAVEIVQSIKYETIIPEKKQVIEIVKTLPLDKETSELLVDVVESNDNVVGDLMKTGAAEELISTYAGGLISSLKGEETELPEFDEETVKEILTNNSDEIAKFVKKHTTYEVTEEQLNNSISKALEDNAKAIVKAVPVVTEIALPDSQEVTLLTKALFGPYVTLSLAIASVIFAVIIFLCRLKGFGGLLWLGVDFGISALITGLIVLASKSVSALLGSLAKIINAVLDAVITVVTTEMLTGAGILLAISALLIVSYALIKNKQKKALSPAVETTVEAVTE